MDFSLVIDYNFRHHVKIVPTGYNQDGSVSRKCFNPETIQFLDGGVDFDYIIFVGFNKGEHLSDYRGINQADALYLFGVSPVNNHYKYYSFRKDDNNEYNFFEDYKNGDIIL